MSSLLAYLNANEVISDGQSKKGFDRLHEVGCLHEKGGREGGRESTNAPRVLPSVPLSLFLSSSFPT